MDEAALRALMSGVRRGVGPSVLRGLLATASLPYRGAVALRNSAYNRGWKRIHRARVPVVSVGNLTTGGTGKTPVVAWLANWFAARSAKVVLLSRGYRALQPDESTTAVGESTVDPRAAAPQMENDEARVLARLCPGIPHVQNPDRVAGAEQCCHEHAAEVILLDDGFQHRRLHRDLDIVLIDATNPWGYGRLLPRGLLREPAKNLRRADLVALTRVDQVSAKSREQLRRQIEALVPPAALLEISFPPAELIPLEKDTPVQSADVLRRQRVMGCCAIGNPSGFLKTLESLAAELCGELQVFPDHHHYQAADLAAVALAAERANAQCVVTTLKDLVKIRVEDWTSQLPLLAVNIGCHISHGGDQLEERLAALQIQQAHHSDKQTSPL